MRRIFAIGLVIVSTLALLGAGAEWVRSYWWHDLIHIRTPSRWIYISSMRGRVSVGTWLNRHHDPVDVFRPLFPVLSKHLEFKRRTLESDGWLTEHNWTTARSRLTFAGFWYLDASAQLVSYRIVYLPWWFVVLMFSIAPIRAGWVWRRGRRRSRVGRCGVCGYDLRASIERCPECGTPIASAVVS